jgi:ketosteroid isomerase-like protein
MSEDDVARVYRSMDCFNRRDIDSYLADLDPDVEFFSGISELEGGGPHRGLDEVRAWCEAVFAAAPDFRVEVEDVRVLEDLTLVRSRLSGHGVESGAPARQLSWQVVESRRNKAVRVRIFRTEAEALAAAGLAAWPPRT